ESSGRTAVSMGWGSVVSDDRTRNCDHRTGKVIIESRKLLIENLSDHRIKRVIIEVPKVIIEPAKPLIGIFTARNFSVTIETKLRMRQKEGTALKLLRTALVAIAAGFLFDQIGMFLPWLL